MLRRIRLAMDGPNLDRGAFKIALDASLDMLGKIPLSCGDGIGFVGGMS